MKEVKVQRRYRCNFCKYKATKRRMEWHEPMCFRNPERFCENCRNRGYTTECHGDLIEKDDCGLSEEIPCPYCSRLDKKMLEEIKTREASLTSSCITG